MGKTAVVFPGQGSQKLGMLSDLADNRTVRAVYELASDHLGYDVWDVTQHDQGKLNQTEFTQPAILTASVALFELHKEKLGQIDMLAGHSLGEYTALVCSGAMAFTDAVQIVAKRGRFMQDAVPAGTGGMAAIIGLADDLVIKACDEAAQGEIVAAVNFNSPGQVVIAGEKAAVERAMANAKEAGAKRALPLPVSVPSHCALMMDAATKLKTELEAIQLFKPDIPVVHNVDVAVHHSSADIVDALVKQLYSPVRWVETIEHMAKEGVAKILEAGPGSVLTGLNKRINKSLELETF